MTPVVAAGDHAGVVLAAVNVSKRFDRVRALDGVSLEVAPGEVHALAGQNGAGKSTLIKILTGYHTPDAGALYLDQSEVCFDSPRVARCAGVSAMYQEVNLIPLRSVAHNLFLGAEPRGRLGLLDRRALHDRARELMGRYGLGTIDVTAEVATFPLGIQQMIALVRAAANSSKVLVMDEPTSALNGAEVDTLFRVVRRLQDDGVAIVYVSHRLDELYTLCDRVTVLRDGAVVAQAPIGQLPRRKLIDAMLGRELLAATERTRSDAEEVERPVVFEARHLHRGEKVRDVSFEVRSGEVLGLAGLLGSGRTETAETIFGIERPSHGDVEVSGTMVRPGSPAAAVRAGLAFLPEDRRSDGIIPNMSIRDNIALAVMARLSKGGVIDRGRVDVIVSEMMERLSIRAYGPDQKVGELSGGNQQKVLLARWLATDPKLIILDDPTRGIDVGAKAEVQTIIRELVARGLGAIVISSELDELVAASDRVVVLDSGALRGELRGRDVQEDQVVAMMAGSTGA